MATFDLRGKKITIKDEDVAFMKSKKLFEFDEFDLIGLILPVVTTGDLKEGLHTPDIDHVIAENTEEQLSALVKRGIEIHRDFLEDG